MAVGVFPSMCSGRRVQAGSLGNKLQRTRIGQYAANLLCHSAFDLILQDVLDTFLFSRADSRSQCI